VITVASSRSVLLLFKLVQPGIADAEVVGNFVLDYPLDLGADVAPIAAFSLY